MSDRAKEMLLESKASDEVTTGATGQKLSDEKLLIVRPLFEQLADNKGIGGQRQTEAEAEYP